MRERLGCAVAIGFGTTELGGGVLATSMEDPDDLQTETVGRLMEGVEIRIVDDQRRELPVGCVGELAVRVDSVMKGYYKTPEATAKVLDQDGWYYTGDLASVDARGYVRIVGRKNDVINRGGKKIFPKEVEDCLIAHASVRLAAAIGVPGRLGGERVWAYVVPEDGVDLDAIGLAEHCRSRIASHKVPEVVRVVPELPTSDSGKVQKYKLRQAAVEELSRGRSRLHKAERKRQPEP
jgi:acyl-CoA synthetase (AMP-forming)/AMP-acid ligase II